MAFLLKLKNITDFNKTHVLVLVFNLDEKFLGSIEEICTNLKQLKRLKISYRTGNLANVSDLRQLENLEELQLHMITHANDDNFGIHIDKEIKDFNKNFFRVMPKLKVYNFLDINYILNYTLYLNGLEKMTPCTLEQFAAKLWSKNDL